MVHLFGSRCVGLAKTGGELSNTELLTCLEMARDVRIQRSAATSRSRIETNKPASAAVPPNVQQLPAGSSVNTTQDREVKKAEEQSGSEVEQAKMEAQSAKALEALANLKLADAETALQRAKEETGRAIAKAERAKVDARGAKELRGSCREQARRCGSSSSESRASLSSRRHDRTTTGPGLGLAGRLRRWLGRPSRSNP